MNNIFRGIYNLSVQYYHEALYNGSEESLRALHYLNDRGINDKTIKYFQLGYGQSGLYDKLINAGFTKEEIEYSGMISSFNHGVYGNLGKEIVESFEEKITMPIIVNNECVWFTSRYIERDWKGKFHSPHYHLRGSKIRYAYNHNELYSNNRKYIVIVESPVDCMTLVQNKIKSIAILGTNSAHGIEDMRELRYFGKVYICFDSDPNGAGQIGAYKLAHHLCQDYSVCGDVDTKIIQIPSPDGKKIDVNDFFRDNNRQDFISLMESAIYYRDTDHYITIAREEAIREQRRKESKDWKFGQLNMKSLKNIVSQYTDLKRSGDKFRGLCPLHSDSKPSFFVYPNNTFFCFSCQLWGGPVEFIRYINERRFGRNLNMKKIEEILKELR